MQKLQEINEKLRAENEGQILKIQAMQTANLDVSAKLQDALAEMSSFQQKCA